MPNARDLRRPHTVTFDCWATLLYEAEEMYLNASLPQIVELLTGSLTEAEFDQHPILLMLLAHSRPRLDQFCWEPEPTDRRLTSSSDSPSTR